MSWFQLDPQSIANRAAAANSPTPSLGASLVRGIAGFTIVSVAGFVPWAFFGRLLSKQIGEAGLYAVCAVIFIGLSAPLLHRLIIGPGSLTRFYQVFGASFAAYSAGWIIGWMTLRGHAGTVSGLFVGAALMGGMLAAAFDARHSTIKVIAALFVLNSIGFYVGEEIEGMLIHRYPLVAKLQWGLCYGIGFGTGLGLAFHLCQSQARALLAQRSKAA